jgi:V/A-type H+-transporting ATPase subunit D
MATLKLTKNQLKEETTRLSRLQKYLPTLQLKKAMLQSEVEKAREEYVHYERAFQGAEDKLARERSRLHEPLGISQDAIEIVEEVKERAENIAGVEIHELEDVLFAPLSYSLYTTPPWIERWIEQVRGVTRLRIEVDLARKKIDALQREWREVSIRVNLFEKVMIPRTQQNIRKIKVFLGDLELASVARAKVAKKKLLEAEAT